MKVSIIIPVYNAGLFLRETLDSIRAQTLADFEVICVDDGSTDSSPEILAEYAAKDSRFKIITQANAGAARARNTGLDVAAGEFLSILDADDRFHADMLEKAVNAIETADADVAVFRYNRFEHETGETTSVMTFPAAVKSVGTVFAPEALPLHLFQMAYNAAWNKIFRRSLVADNGLYFQEIPRFNDAAFTLLALAVAQKITLVDEPLLDYRLSSGSNLQSGLAQTPMIFLDVFKKLWNDLQQRGIAEKFRLAFFNAFVDNALYSLAALKEHDGFQKQYEAVRNIAFQTFDLSCMTAPENWCSVSLFEEYSFICRHEDYFAYLQFLLDRRKKRVAQFKQRNLELKQQNDTVRQRNIELKSQNDTFKQRNIELKSQNDTFKQRNIELKSQNDTFKQRNIELKQQNSAFRQRNAELKEQNSLFKQKNSALKQQNSAVKQRNLEFKQQNQELKKRNHALKLQNDKLLQKNRELQNSLAYRIGRLFTFLPGKVKQLLHK